MAGTRYGNEPARITNPPTGQTWVTGTNRLIATAIAPPVDVVAVPPGDKAVTVPAKATAVTATEWQPLLISMARGVAEAFVLAAVAVFTMLAAVPDADARAILIVAGATFFTKLAAAFGFGTVDQRTATKEG